MPSKVIQIRVLDDLAEWIKENGGSAFARDILIKAKREQEEREEEEETSPIMFPLPAGVFDIVSPWDVNVGLLDLDFVFLLTATVWLVRKLA